MPSTDTETCNDEIENAANSDTDEIPEYDSSSDEEQVEETAAVLELDRASTFLVGVSTRFRRQVRINNRFISQAHSLDRFAIFLGPGIYKC